LAVASQRRQLNNNEPRCPRKFLTQPTEFEKSGVLQHPLARKAKGRAAVLE